MFEADLSRALEEEYEHQHADFEHEREVELAHEYGHHLEPIHMSEEGHHGDFVEHEMIEEPSWRDDKYHDHDGFNLQMDLGHSDMRHESREEGVEHWDNERLH